MGNHAIGGHKVTMGWGGNVQGWGRWCVGHGKKVNVTAGKVGVR